MKKGRKLHIILYGGAETTLGDRGQLNILYCPVEPYTNPASTEMFCYINSKVATFPRAYYRMTLPSPMEPCYSKGSRGQLNFKKRGKLLGD